MLSAEHQGAPQLMNATRMALGIQIVNMALRQAELKLHGSRASGQESGRENYECVSQLVCEDRGATSGVSCPGALHPDVDQATVA